MIAVAALFVAGALTAMLCLRLLGGVLANPLLSRENFRGRNLPTAAGLCLVLAMIAVESVRSAVDSSITVERLLVLAAVVAFGFLGLVDDLLGDAGDRGIGGHVRAAVRGRLTTGFVKLIGGAAVGLVLARAAGGGSLARTIVDAAVIALAANLGNLLDRSPGRTGKWALVACIPLVAGAGGGDVGSAVAPAAGATIGLLPGDLRERYMLGDTGANALGAALGTAAVLEIGPEARVILAAVLLGLNLLSEFASFSKIIDAVPPLRAFDRVGRRAR